MAKRSDKKRELILLKAKQVFLRKGFASVTMKDIIEECEISRGGIYLYFKSVEEIFMQVILSRDQRRLNEARASTHENKSFNELIDEYFEKQKKRLLNMQDSLLMAMHEYRFSHRSEEDKRFYYDQFMNTKEILLALLNYGVSQDEIDGYDIEYLAIHIMYFIEGISTTATSFGVSEEMIDSQIRFMKRLIFSHKQRD